MFKGKVYLYKNINGKEKKIDKEFDNEEDYKNFLEENPEFNWSSNVENFVNYPWLLGFENFLDDFVNKKLWRVWWEDTKKQLPSGDTIDLSEYENEYSRIEEEKQKKEERRKEMESTLEKLKNYKKRFKEEGKEDLVKKIDKDIEKVQNDLKQYKGE